MTGLLVAVIMLAIVEVGVIAYLWHIDKQMKDIQLDKLIKEKPWTEPEPTEPEPTEPEPVARPIVPDDPPHWTVYSPPPGKQPPFCTCHGQPLESGQRVLLWPVPHANGRIDIFHVDALELVEPE